MLEREECLPGNDSNNGLWIAGEGSSSQEVTKTRRGGHGGGEQDHRLDELQQLAVGLGEGTEERGDILKMGCFLVMVTVRDIRRGREEARVGGNSLRGAGPQESRDSSR